MAGPEGAEAAAYAASAVLNLGTNAAGGKKPLKRLRKSLWIVLVTLVLFFVLEQTYTLSGGALSQRAALLSDGWYLEATGEAVDLAAPVACRSDRPFVVCNDTLGAESAGKVLTTRGAQYGLTVSLDGETLYEYRDVYFERNTQMRSKQDCDAAIPQGFQGGTLRLSYQVPRDGKYQFSQVRIGSETEVFIQHLWDGAATYALAFLFAILGVIAIGVAVYLSFCSLDKRRFVDAAVFLLLCSLWFVTDSSLVQQYSGNASLVCVVSFYAFMLFSVPMLHLVQNTGGMGKYRVLDVLIACFYINAIVQGLLNLCLGIPFIDMLFVTHLLLAGGVGIVTALAVKECAQTDDREIRLILAAFATVAASGVLALVLYWLLEVPYYGSLFEVGVLIFVILILANIMISMVRNIHYRTEMQAYERMAREDWMTGMGNRQPFEELLSELQRGERTYENAALIFMDLNHLKRVNDEYGHAAGDELIVGAARCIQNVFGAAGSCFRIGGDEFGVVLPNPEEPYSVWFDRLEEAIRRFNQGSRYRLSIAKGWSDLRGEDGLFKSVSDWKYEADSRMYQDKGRAIKHDRGV